MDNSYAMRWRWLIAAAVAALWAGFVATRPQEGHAEALATYYDALSASVRATNPLQYGDATANMTFHSALRVPAELRATGKYGGAEFAPAFLNDLIVDELRARGVREPHTLDAGCGWGGTALAVQAALGGSALGLTLSPVQAAAANAAAAARGVGGKVRFEVGSFDAPLDDERFDVIVAVEALVHAPDGRATLLGFGELLRPGGVLLVVDDSVARPELRADADVLEFARTWHAPSVELTPADYRTWFEGGLGLEQVTQRDLFRDYGFPIGHPLRLRVAGWLSAALMPVMPTAAWREVMGSWVGGLARQRLYREGKLEYVMVVGSAGGREPPRVWGLEDPGVGVVHRVHRSSGGD